MRKTIGAEHFVQVDEVDSGQPADADESRVGLVDDVWCQEEQLEDADAVEILPLELQEELKESGSQLVGLAEVLKTSGPYRYEWKCAMEKELASMAEKQVFEELTEEEAKSICPRICLPTKLVLTIKEKDDSKR